MCACTPAPGIGKSHHRLCPHSLSRLGNPDQTTWISGTFVTNPPQLRMGCGSCVYAELIAGKMVGQDDVQVDSVLETVTSREEVSPMNAVSLWVLHVFVTVG